MASAPPQSTPAQHSSPAQPHPNRVKQEVSQNGHGDQLYKQNGRNPSHKKGWSRREGQHEGQHVNGNQDMRERPRRREKDDNEVNGSPRSSEEYRDRRERGGRARGPRENPITNGTHVNGTAKPESSSANGVEEAKTGVVHNDTTKQNEVSIAAEYQLNELQEQFPSVPADKIASIVRKNNYDPNKSAREIESMQHKQAGGAWTDVVKGKASKPAIAAPPAAPVPNAPQENLTPPKREKRKEDAHDQPQQPRRHQNQQHAQQPPPLQQPSTPQQLSAPSHQQHHHQQQQQHQHHQQMLQQQQQQQIHQHQQAYHQYPPTNYQYHHHAQQQQYQPLHQQAPSHTQNDHITTQDQQAQQDPSLHAVQVYHAQPIKTDDMLGSLSKLIELQLAEVQKKTETLSSLKTQLDSVHNSDKDHRTQLETKRVQLEADRHNYAEQLRICESELETVEQLIKNAEEDKRRKIEDLCRNFQSHGVLAIANS